MPHTPEELESHLTPYCAQIPVCVVSPERLLRFLHLAPQAHDCTEEEAVVLVRAQEWMRRAPHELRKAKTQAAQVLSVRLKSEQSSHRLDRGAGECGASLLRAARGGAHGEGRAADGRGRPPGSARRHAPACDAGVSQGKPASGVPSHLA